MEVDFAFLCDYAENAAKVNALGIGFDTISAPEVPCRHGQMHLVVQFRANVTEQGIKRARIEMIDADGGSVATVEGEMDIRVPDGGTEALARLAVAFNGIEFPRFGDYSIHILIDDNEMKRIGFHVVRLTPTS